MEKKEVANDSNVNSESCLFITENDRFDVKIKYNEQGAKLLVEDIDDDFVSTDATKEIIMTFKYPSQGDYDLISRAYGKAMLTKEFDIKDFMNLELTRMLTLIRKWSLKKPLATDNILQLQPKIVKAAIVGIRKEIKMEGIV